MRFWELIAIFRDEKNILETEFKTSRWYKYAENYKNLDSIIDSQNRNILDAEVEDDLLRAICSKSKKKIYYSDGDKKIFSYKNRDTIYEIPILKAINLFEHSNIEEVFEKTESDDYPLSADELDFLFLPHESPPDLNK